MSLLMDALRKAEESKQRSRESHTVADNAVPTVQPLTEQTAAATSLNLDWGNTFNQVKPEAEVEDAEIVEETTREQKKTMVATTSSPLLDLDLPDTEQPISTDKAAAATVTETDHANEPPSTHINPALFDTSLEWSESPRERALNRKIAASAAALPVDNSYSEEVAKTVLDWDDSLADLFAQDKTTRTEPAATTAVKTEAVETETAADESAEQSPVSAEDSAVSLIEQPADIDPNELDWTVALDTDSTAIPILLEEEADTVALATEADLLLADEVAAKSDEVAPPTVRTESEPEVDWTQVSIETPEPDTVPTLDLNLEALIRENTAPTVEADAPDPAPANDLVAESKAAAPPPAALTESDNAPAAVPTLDLQFADFTSPPVTASTANATSSDWREDNQAPTAKKTGLNWDGLLGDDSTATPQRTKDALGLEWDMAVMPNLDMGALPPLSATDHRQTDKTQQQKAQAILHKSRPWRASRWMGLYGLMGLGLIALLGIFAIQFVINEQKYGGNQTQYFAADNPPPTVPPIAVTTSPTADPGAVTNSVTADSTPPSPAAPVTPPTATPPLTASTDLSADSPSTASSQPATTPAPVETVPSQAATVADATVVVADTGSAVVETVADQSATVSRPSAAKQVPDTTTQTMTKTTRSTVPTAEPTESAPSNRVAEAAPAVDMVKKPPRYPHSMDDSLPDAANRMPEIQRHNALLRTQRLNETLNSAYGAVQNQRLSEASRLYQSALQQDAVNRDALLGLAHIALQQGQPLQAQQYYQQVLKQYPEDRTARLGLLAATNDTQPARSERELRELLHEESADKGYVHFALGSLYAGQSRWAAAQQAFFDAWRHDKQQANYAYNLAVSLEHLGQSDTALHYYQQALQLAQRSTAQPASFDLQMVQKRVQMLLAHNGNTGLSQRLMGE